MSTRDHGNRPDNTVAAADWYARLRAQDVTEIDGLRFRAWLSGAPERRREFEALECLWEEVRKLEQSPAMQRTRKAIAARRRKAARPRARRVWATAAALLVVVALGGWCWHWLTAGVYATDVGELRAVPLGDGSVVTLNTATRVRVHYTSTSRRIELLKGQASFEVAKDPARPFVVGVGDREVRALGTVFDVYKAQDKVIVTLIEGEVAVSPARARSVAVDQPAGAASPRLSQSKDESLILRPGQQVSYRPAVPNEPMEPIAVEDVPRVTAWRVRKLAFRDTLLTEAIAEANRYSKEQIVLEAPGLEGARLSGSFEAGRNDVFAEGLQTFFGLQVVRQGDGRIVLLQPTQ